MFLISAEEYITEKCHHSEQVLQIRIHKLAQAYEPTPEPVREHSQAAHRLCETLQFISSV